MVVADTAAATAVLVVGVVRDAITTCLEVKELHLRTKPWRVAGLVYLSRQLPCKRATGSAALCLSLAANFTLCARH